ncbi:PAS domain S-box protein [Aliifodinibius sp. S!AR15-10]|uniref:two-component system sensor histidine kinase NtrB n=1 Tax=Aliifodinibius sp. S!AR15-10 TaxID=2950437 RepID=UPI0028559CE4|nr:ATP-binding protein [Aliifodinibius sp. S!AR15-10]MDR8391345.1 PAS domain S-box protein [Aliifodinibius sp. S!AR15-10]
MRELLKFFKYVRLGYLLFTSLLILGAVFGFFEIVQLTILENPSLSTLRWLYFTRGVLVAFLLVSWAAWTVYNYRQLYEDKLEVAEGRYKDIIEHSADAIISVNNDDTITSWNRGAEKIFGWNREEIIGKSMKIFIPEDLLEARELDCLEFGMTYRGYVQNYETERLTKSGKRVLVSLTESFIRDVDGEIVGRSQVLRDLTELRMREEQVQQSERLAAVGHMAAGVAHEIGNPLTAISSLTQLVLRRTEDDFAREQLAKVREQIQRINKIVRDLVDFSRPSSLDRKETQVNRIIESAVGLLKHDARCRDVNFNLELSPNLPEVLCVPDHIHQVLVNLLLNAVDAMKEIEEPKIIVETTRTKEPDGIQIKVSDIGTGITEEHMDHIFEPFFTTKEVGAGTGLGLSVSHGIINKMGGNIAVDSTPGEGTTFNIVLPIRTYNNQPQQ